MTMASRICDGYSRTAAGLAADLGPIVLLLMRIWVAVAFWRAGVVKIADPESTRMLFESVYHVPLLAPDVAAFVGTWVELIVPWFIVLGLLARPFALFLFIYNLVAVVSYPDLWPHGFWTGLFNLSDFADHKVWGLMLLAVLAWGAGKWSLDGLSMQIWRGRRSTPPIRRNAAHGTGARP